MKDRYPALDTIPAASLVAPESQPDYAAPVARRSGAGNVGLAIAGAAAVAARRDAVAVIHHESGETLTFGDLERRSDAAAAALLRAGLRIGERVAFRSHNVPEAIATIMGTWKAGGIVVPTPPLTRAAELRFLLTDTGARFLMVQNKPGLIEEVAGGIAGTPVAHVFAFPNADGTPYRSWPETQAAAGPTDPAPATDPDMPAIIWHTGGTTGVPKACYHTHRRFLHAGDAAAAVTGVRQGERWAAAAPIGHALGFIYHTIYTLLHGATVVLVEEFAKPERILEAIARHHVDTFTAIAASWAAMLERLRAEGASYDLGSLRRAYAMWQSSSSTVIRDGWRERGLELMNNFGSTAFATWILAPRAGESFPATTLGKPAPGYEIIAVDPDARPLCPLEPGSIGRMAVRGPTGLTYWNRHAEQARDVVEGWSLSDDLIQMHPSGNFMYLGRTDYMISTAGYKVAPVEVEEVLAKHPAVREVAVLAAPDPIRQEIVMAFVVVSDGFSAGGALTAELQDLVKQALAPYKYPRRIDFIPALPRDAVGKVQTGVLKRWAEEPAASR